MDNIEDLKEIVDAQQKLIETLINDRFKIEPLINDRIKKE